MANDSKSPASRMKKGPPRPPEAMRYIRPMCIILADEPEQSGQTVSIVVTSTHADGSKFVVEIPNVRSGETCLEVAPQLRMPK